MTEGKFLNKAGKLEVDKEMRDVTTLHMLDCYCN